MDYDKNKWIKEWYEYFIKYSFLVRNRWECIDYLDRKKYQTLPYVIRYYIDYRNKNEYVDIPASYIFDFNSAPCFWHCVVDRDEFCIWLVHDWLFDKRCKLIVKDQNNLSERFKKLEKYCIWTSTHFNWDKTYTEILYTRKFADIIWLEGAKEEAKEIERVNKDTKAFLWYLAIRLWGGLSFRK